METIIKYLLCAVALSASLFAKGNVTDPPENTNCNSAILICPGNTSHTFGASSDDDPCTPGTNIRLFYYFYINAPLTINVAFSGVMNGFQFYGPLSSNPIDACEQYNQNSATFISSSQVQNSFYPVLTPQNPDFVAGLYLLVVNIDHCSAGTIQFSAEIAIPVPGLISCEPQVPCENCVASFELEEGKSYMVSAWTKEEGAPASKTNYDQPFIEMEFTDGNVSLALFNFQPSGVIIDGWQRIEGKFEIPAGTANMEIRLKTIVGEAYFDDVRIFPFDGSMKSYVYDPVSLRLMAELDERNYATFYEYDEEGKLVRVKKETERGVMTIQENKTFIKKE